MKKVKIELSFIINSESDSQVIDKLKCSMNAHDTQSQNTIVTQFDDNEDLISLLKTLLINWTAGRKFNIAKSHLKKFNDFTTKIKSK